MSWSQRLLVPLAFLGFAILYGFETRDLPVRATAFPRVTIVFIAVFAVAFIAREIRDGFREPRPSPRNPSGRFRPLAWLADSEFGLRSVSLVVVAFGLYLAGVNLVNFFFGTALFVVVVTFILAGWRNLRVALTMAAVTLVISEVLFSRALGILLP